MKKTNTAAILTAAVMVAAEASAGWTYNSGANTITDGANWTLGVQSVTVNGVSGLRITDVTAGSGDLDLTTFEADTGSKVISVANSRQGEVFGGSPTTGWQPITTFTGPDVIELQDYAFQNRTNLTTISVSSNIVTIGTWACAYCTRLTTFSPTYMPELASLGGKAFGASTLLVGDFYFGKITSFNDVFNANLAGGPWCTKVTSVVAPLATAVGSKGCYGMSSLTNAVFSSDITDIGSAAFGSCSNLKYFYPNPATWTNLTTLGGGAFRFVPFSEGCTDFYIPKITTVQQSTFSSSGITSIHAENVTNLYASCFQSAASLTNAVFSNACNRVGARAFMNCTKLKHITPFLGENLLPDFGTFNAISGNDNYRPFEGCAQLTDHLLIDSPSLVTLVEFAFGGCRALTNITIRADTLETIDTSAFYDIGYGTAIPSIWYESRYAPKTIGANAFRRNGCNNYVRIYVKDGQDIAGWSAFYTPKDQLTPAQLARADYPGQKTLGLIQSNGNYAWVVNWPVIPKGTVITIR